MPRFSNRLFKACPQAGDDTIGDFGAGPGSEDTSDQTDFGSAELLADIARIGSDAVLQTASGDSLTVAGVDRDDLHQDDFIL